MFVIRAASYSTAANLRRRCRVPAQSHVNQPASSDRRLASADTGELWRAVDLWAKSPPLGSSGARLDAWDVGASLSVRVPGR